MAMLHPVPEKTSTKRLVARRWAWRAVAIDGKAWRRGASRGEEIPIANQANN